MVEGKKTAIPTPRERCKSEKKKIQRMLIEFDRIKATWWFRCWFNLSPCVNRNLIWVWLSCDSIFHMLSADQIFYLLRDQAGNSCKPVVDVNTVKCLFCNGLLCIKLPLEMNGNNTIKHGMQFIKFSSINQEKNERFCFCTQDQVIVTPRTVNFLLYTLVQCEMQALHYKQPMNNECNRAVGRREKI